MTPSRLRRGFIFCMIRSMELYAILYNIRSIQNVGSMFRTADAVGVSKIYLCGITPTPVDRLGKPRSDFVKVSLGAENTVAWEYIARVGPLIKRLQREGVRIVTLEQSKQARDIFSYKSRGDTALIVGNEVEGVPASVLKLCDDILEIPMRGKKESLNVSVAFGVAAYAILDRM